MHPLETHFEKWCVWRRGPKRNDGKPVKLPVNPHTAQVARTNTPDTFGTYQEACSMLAQGAYAGLGVLMSSSRGVVCIDIDNCLDDTGAPNPVASWALKNFAGYVEVSQSGRGLHFFARGIVPNGCREKLTVEGASLELYGPESTRFICVTAKLLDDRGEVINEQGALERLIDRFGLLCAPDPDTDTATDADTRYTSSETYSKEHSDAEVLALLRQNNKRGRITRLLNGDVSDYRGDHSSADLALASEIAFYTCDAQQIERLISGCVIGQRAKWRERADYRSRTVTKALDSARRSYWDGKAARAHAEEHAIVSRARRAAFLQIDVSQLVLTSKGQIASNVSNAVRVLANDRRTCGLVGFNEFANVAQVVGTLRPVFGVSASEALGELQEADLTPVRTWLIREYGIDLSKADVYDAVLDWARHSRFNPVVEKLSTLAREWDGISRIDSWLNRYLGVNTDANSEYVKDVGRKWLIGAVARAIRPGCKMDTVLIFEGPQGAGKSSAARILAEAVYPGGFVDSVPMLGDRHESARALTGAFIVELAELTTFRKAEAELVKSFLTTQADRVREPYARRYENRPRTCVFVGTTNEVEYNPDPSGGRRFWSVTVGRADLAGLVQDAPQLWAEAVIAFQKGEPWYLQDEATIRQASELATNRMLSDTWDESIRDFMEKLPAQSRFSQTWSMVELFEEVFPRDSLNMRAIGDQRRFANALRRAGFAARKTNGRMRWFVLPQAGGLAKIAA